MGSEVDMTTEQTVALEFAKYRLKTERKRIIALGLFDSVHLGHRSIIDYTFETAKRLNMTPAILTFDNDFFSALGRSDKLIYTLHERVKILEEVFKTRGMHEFKKVEFAQMVKRNIKTHADISSEILDIIREIGCGNIESNIN